MIRPWESPRLRCRIGRSRWVLWFQGRPWGWGSYHSERQRSGGFFVVWVFGPLNIQRWRVITQPVIRPEGEEQ